MWMEIEEIIVNKMVFFKRFCATGEEQGLRWRV